MLYFANMKIAQAFHPLLSSFEVILRNQLHYALAHHFSDGTWQGSVTWVEEQREQHFRSALELLKLIDGALDNNYEVRIEE